MDRHSGVLRGQKEQGPEEKRSGGVEYSLYMDLSRINPYISPHSGCRKLLSLSSHALSLDTVLLRLYDTSGKTRWCGIMHTPVVSFLLFLSFFSPHFHITHLPCYIGTRRSTVQFRQQELLIGLYPLECQKWAFSSVRLLAFFVSWSSSTFGWII